ESMRSSKPRTSTNVRSRRSAGGTRSVQSPEAREVGSQGAAQDANPADTWIKFAVWFVVMGALLGDGMYQRDTLLLLTVVVVVTDGCGYARTASVLLKLLETKSLKP